LARQILAQAVEALEDFLVLADKDSIHRNLVVTSEICLKISSVEPQDGVSKMMGAVAG
jgi:hypothetical protein